MHTHSPLYRSASRALLSAIALLSAVTANAQSFTADFSSPAIDPNLSVNQWDGAGHYLPGTLADWSVTSGGGALLISLAPHANPYLSDGPHVQTRRSTVSYPGDFVATVTIDTSGNTGGSAGFFMEPNAGYAGVGFYNGNIQFSSSFPGTFGASTGLTSATVQLVRTGQTLTIRYKAVGAASYSLLGSCTDAGLAGPVHFDMTNYAFAGPAWPNPVTAAFRDLSVAPLSAPVLTAPTDLVVEATSAGGAAVTFSANAHDDVDGDIPVVYSVAPGSVFPLGTTTVTATATNSSGNSASASFTVTVRDTTPPGIAALTASPESIWPANNKLVPVTLVASVNDLVDAHPVVKIVSVSANEPGSGDWQITGDLSLLVRATRKGGGAGRIYTIVVRATDAAGNAATRSVQLRVPHDQGKP